MSRNVAGRGLFVGAACAACCAPPMIAALGVAVGLAAVAGLVLGIAAAVAVVLAGTGWLVLRLRRHPAAAPSAQPGDASPVAVPIGPPRRRTGTARPPGA